MTDDVVDAADDAARAGKEAREAAQNAETVAEGLEGKAAKAAEGAGKGGSNTIPNVESALGYNQSNADDLMRRIYEKLSSSEAVLGKLDEYGQRYTVDIPITGPNGNTVNVRTGWIIRTDSDIPELTAIFVKE